MKYFLLENKLVNILSARPALSIFKKHKLQISGDFGVVILTFSSKNKRDQVLDTIARYNGMI